MEYYGLKQFKVVNVLDDERFAQHLKKYSKCQTIPQLYIKGQMYDLREYDYLKQALVENGLVKV